MADDKLWDLHIYFHGTKVGEIGNVDAERFSYVVLLDALNDLALKDMPAGVDKCICIKNVDLFRSCHMHELLTDMDVMEMFLEYRNEDHINLYLTTDNAIPIVVDTSGSRQTPEKSAHPSKSTPRNPVSLDTSSASDSPPHGTPEDGPRRRAEWEEDVGTEEVRRRLFDEECESLNGDEDVYGLSDEDVYGLSDEDHDWREEDGTVDGECSEESMSDWENEMVSEVESGEDSESNKDELSDYNSGDQEGYPVSDDELSNGCTDMYKLFAGIPPRTDCRGKVVLERNMIFESVQQFRSVVRDFAIENGFTLKRIKNENIRCTLGCMHEGCPWRIHASVLGDGKSFKVKTYNHVHNFPRVQFNPEANSSWIAKKMLDNFRKNPSMKLSTLQEKLRKRYGLEINCQQQLWRAKIKAIEMIEGSHNKAYGLLPTYGEHLFQKNPGTKFILQCDTRGPRPIFERLFVCLPGLRNGFIKGCRPFIGLDGCHLKGTYKGVLLSVVGLDANNGVYPIAIVVVDSENTQSWEFFLEELGKVLQIHQVNTQWTFMTDGQKGLDTVVQDCFPGAEHRRCAWHLFNNFKGKFPGVLLARYFWEAVRAYRLTNFDSAMERIKALNFEAYEWLMKLHVKHWSRHAFPLGLKCDQITNNHTESFNGWVGGLRERNVIGLVDGM